MRNTPKPIFLDPTGRRAWSLRAASALIALFAVLLLVGFVASVAFAPRFAMVGVDATPMHGPPLLRRPAGKLAALRKVLFARIAADHRARHTVAPIVAANQISGAYFQPWQDHAIDSFHAHASGLTHVYPAWISLSSDGRSINTDNWRPDKSLYTKDLVLTARANGVRIVPIVQNAEGGVFDLKRLKVMLDDPAASASMAKALNDFIAANNYQGLQIDFELLDAPTATKLAPWIAGLAKTFHAQGREISVTLDADLDLDAARSLAQAADYAVVMAYDEHGVFSGAGPIASAGYIETTLKRFAGIAPANKLLLGVGAYGYDWNVRDQFAEPISNQVAIALASRFRGQSAPKDVIDFDAAALEPTFQYMDAHDALHEVWFLDAVTAQNSLVLAHNYGLRGAALWSLGQEDASVWNTFGRHTPAKPDLHSVIIPESVSFIGDGELLRVLRHPQPGARTYDVDPVNHLVTDETYTAYPSGWLVERSGAPEKTVALTFDDGPDPTWTPKILAVLKRHNVKATFFMIGEQVGDYPDIVRKVYADGHEIGSHSFTHPNMAHVSEERVRLELAATQRAFEAVLGHSVVLFRPPYNADSEPKSYGEIMPVAVADQSGYVTAGETIDANDWDINRRDAAGNVHRLTGAEIDDAVLAQLAKGQAILLHDGGGDRSATLASLDNMITTLQARGYHFSTMGELEGHGRDWSMPILPKSERSIARMDAFAFTVRRDFNKFIFWGFTSAIALGLARIALMIGLAARPRRARPELLELPRVDVMIAAYNEAPVILRTIRSLLASQSVDVRLIVVDDGSTDGTGDIVAAAYGAHTRVRLERKLNGGKASALNQALALAQADIVVGVDADTQLAPNALALLARWFVDPTVGAVAGNVKVGNRKRLVTRWQSIEYITSQNVDRRAMSRLNAITVVPGAIGAYRKSALDEVGGYRSDTLAEDMDLTWRLRRADWIAVNEPDAFAYTEAPETLGGLMRQRFRWSFGTLQCLWKHRSATFRYGWFGGLALPTLWVFQIGAQVIAPLVDLQLVLAAVGWVMGWVRSLQHVEVMPTSDSPVLLVAIIYVAFLGLEIAAGWLAYEFDNEDKRDLWLLPTQRVVYRQIMYIVVWRALMRAFGGAGQAWGKLARTGGVHMGEDHGHDGHAPEGRVHIEQPELS